VIKFQARVSQAKIPASDGELRTLSLRLIDLADSGLLRSACRSYRDVRIRNGTLSLDYSPPGCDLSSFVAASSNLALEAVIGGYSIAAIPLGTVPFAVKVDHAAAVQNAVHAGLAAQAYYAHRVTADRNTATAGVLGSGYYDFYSHSAVPQLYPSGHEQYADGGSIQWTPMYAEGAAVNGGGTLHVCAKDGATDSPVPLRALVLHSDLTTARGAVHLRVGVSFRVTRSGSRAA